MRLMNTTLFLMGGVLLAASPPARAQTPVPPPPPAAPSEAAAVADATALPAAAKGKLALFLLMGQSNMVGQGLVKDSTSKPHERVWALGGDYKWKPAADPLHDSAGQLDAVWLNKNAGVGPGMAFALELVKADPNIQIGLAPCAKGGTPLHFFLKERGTGRDTLYGSALHRAREAQKAGTLAGVLFYQGEGDANDGAKRPETFGGKWGDKFAELVRDLRADLNAPNLPIVFAQLGTTKSKAHVRWEEVKASQAKVAIPGVSMIKTDDLTLKDNVHFTTPSYEEIGRRFARAYRAQKTALPVVKP